MELNEKIYGEQIKELNNLIKQKENEALFLKKHIDKLSDPKIFIKENSPSWSNLILSEIVKASIILLVSVYFNKILVKKEVKEKVKEATE